MDFFLVEHRGFGGATHLNPKVPVAPIPSQSDGEGFFIDPIYSRKKKVHPEGWTFFLVEHRGFEPLTPTLPV